MGLLIEDGKGKGYQASVSSENKLAVESVSSSIEHYINHKKGRAFSLSFDQSPTAADDCILFIQNQDNDELVIEEITLGIVDCTANDSLYIKVGDEGTRNSATTITPVNNNQGSGISAIGIFEKGADLDGGSATLSGGNEIVRYVMAGVTDRVSSCINFPQDIILPKNRTLSMWVGGSATGTYYITIHFNYHTLEE